VLSSPENSPPPPMREGELLRCALDVIQRMAKNQKPGAVIRPPGWYVNPLSHCLLLPLLLLLLLLLLYGNGVADWYDRYRRTMEKPDRPEVWVKDAVGGFVRPWRVGDGPVGRGCNTQ
jgi:hypothetical protein